MAIARTVRGARKTALVTSLLGVALASQAGAAFASEGHDDHHDGDTQSGIANVDDTSTIVPTDLCNNDVPINALGVQIPVQDVAGSIPILSPSGDGGGNTAGVDKGCGSDVSSDSE